MVATLRVAGLGKRYGGNTALEGVSFEIAAGEVLALVGANGAGKSTLIKCALGLLRHTGSVMVGGIELERHPKQAKRLIGYLPQSPSLHPDLSVRETALFYADLKGVPHERAREEVAAVGLGAHGDARVDALSGGMRQRLALALALLAEPPLLLLDEPAAGLDISARLDLRRLIQEQRTRGAAVLLSTHWLEDVPYVADRVLVLDRGSMRSIGPASDLEALGAPSSRLYLRLNGRGADAIPLLERLFPHDPVARTGDWLVVTTAAAHKARVVEAVVEAGITILDLRVEEVTAGALADERQGMTL